MNLTKKTTITVLIGIILLGAILRFYHLGSTSFVADEFLDINSSMAYAKTGQWQNWDFNFGQINNDNVFQARDERAWPYKWQVAEVLKIAKPSESAARSVSALWGVISIILIYFVTTYFTKKKEIGLLSAFLFAVSISGIIFDRRLRMYSMFFPVYLAFSWLLFRFFEEEYGGKINLIKFFWKKWQINIIYLIPAIILGILSILIHQLTANIVFAVLFYSIIKLFGQKNKFSLYNKYFLTVAIIVLGYIGALIFIPKQLALYTAGLGLTNHAAYISKVFGDYSHWLLALIVAMYGAWWLYKKEKLRSEGLWLAVSFFGILVVASFIWSRNMGDQYIFFIKSFGIIILASGIYGMAEFFGKNLAQYGKRAIYIPLVMALLILPSWGYFFQDDNTYRQTSDGDSANYKKVFAYFAKYKKPDDVMITRNFRNFYWTGAKMKVYDFGGELAKDKLSLAEVQDIINSNQNGWVIFSDNDTDYVSNEALDYITKNLTRVSNPQVRGKVMVYRWGNLL